LSQRLNEKCPKGKRPFWDKGGYKNVKIQKKIHKILLLIILLIFFSINLSYSADLDEQTIGEQQQTFGIQSFIENSKEYTGEFFNDIDIGDILNSAIKGEIDNSTIYKRILHVLGTEVEVGIKSLVSILVIIIIHSILKSISESLENDGICKLIYYVQYIAIVTVVMTNFSDVIQMVKTTTENLVGFINT